MPRKTFLSFLGTNNYEPVSYWIARSSGNADLEKYVQKTILNHLAPGFSADDQAYIFLTDEARAANWENNGHYDRKEKTAISNIGLAQQIENAHYPFSVTPIDLNGESEPEAIWQTFERVYDCLQTGDEVYLDITHSWRYLPMLGMTLLNYAKVLKNIEVKAIYYGAFEQLGKAHEVKQLPMDERPVPILDLVSFSDLQDWSAAAHDFVHYGKTERWHALSNTTLQPILSQTKGQDQVASNLRHITKQMSNLTALIATNRGRSLMEYNFEQLQQALDRFSAEHNYIKPLNGIIHQVKEKIASFDTDATRLNWLHAVGWCLDHGLIQQGITQLQEGLQTYLCQHFEKNKIAPGLFGWQKEKGRDLVSGCLNIIHFERSEHEWYGAAKKYREIAVRMINDPVMKKFSPIYAGLTQIRNDINHGGYTKNSKAKVFYSELDKQYNKIKDIIEEIRIKELNQPSGLLNLSNHPSTSWSDDQKQAAVQRYGRIADLAFPQIDPQASVEDIDRLAEDYLQHILDIRPVAVHLMGEMTFTHALVNKLKAAGIPCIASTTERIVEEKNGKKIVQFRFIAFRFYA